MVDRYYRKINDVENNIENAMQIFSILLKLKGYDEKLDDFGKITTNENNISSNLSKINNIENDIAIKIRKDVYDKTFVISNMSTNKNIDLIGDIYINSKFTTDGIIKFNAIYNYSYDKNNNFSHVYNFYSNDKKFKRVKLNHNIISNVVNDKFDIQAIDSTRINILIYIVNNNKNNKLIESFDNNIQVIYNDNIDVLKSDTNKNNFSSNLLKINDNENNISNNLEKINDNENNISSNLSKIDNFTQYILKSGKDFEQKHIIEKQIFRFNKDKHFYTIFEKEIEYHFTKNSLLFAKNNMYYKYDHLSNDYFRLQHEYNIYDDKDNLIHKYLFNKDTYYDESLDPILHTNEDFCICFTKKL